MKDVWSCSPGYCCSSNHLKAEHELVSHLCVFSGDIHNRVYEQNIELMALIWLLSCVCSHMKFTLLFCTKHLPRWLHSLGFSSVCFIAWRIGSLFCKKTLIIFVRSGLADILFKKDKLDEHIINWFIYTRESHRVCLTRNGADLIYVLLHMRGTWLYGTNILTYIEPCTAYN